MRLLNRRTSVVAASGDQNLLHEFSGPPRRSRIAITPWSRISIAGMRVPSLGTDHHPLVHDLVSRSVDQLHQVGG